MKADAELLERLDEIVGLLDRARSPQGGWLYDPNGDKVPAHCRSWEAASNKVRHALVTLTAKMRAGVLR